MWIVFLTPKNINVDSIIGIKSFDGKINVADLESGQLNNSKTYFDSVENFFKAQEDSWLFAESWILCTGALSPKITLILNIPRFLIFADEYY